MNTSTSLAREMKNNGLRVIVCITLLMLSSAMASGRIIENWQYRHPLPHNQTLWKIAHAEGVYVLTGAGGVITTSTDLVEWDSTFYPELGSLDGLLYAEGSFLATSRSGQILTSADGLSWTMRPTGAGKGLLNAAYGNGRYVLTGEDGTTATSTDLENWTISDTGDNNWYFGVTYGNGLFVAASFDSTNGFNTGSIATSTNGADWTLVNLPASFPSYIEFYDVSFANGQFVASGYFFDEISLFYGVFIATSSDGLTWERSVNGVPQTNSSDSTPLYLNMVRYDSTTSTWLGVGDRSVLMTSSDAVNWTATFPLGNSTTDFFGIGFSPEGRAMVGSRADVYFSANGSSDWERKFSGNYSSISDIAYNGSLYVATGSTIHTSPDGKDWTVQSGGQPGGTLANVVYGAGRWVAASRNNTSQIPLTTSADGTNWAFPPSLPDEFTDCRDIAFGNGIFVALPQSGPSSLVTSTDGLTWTGRNPNWFKAKLDRCYVTFDNGIFLAYSVPVTSVEIATSVDGVNWTTRSTTLTGTYHDAAYGDGRWILVGTNGMVATSTNLTDWTEQEISFADRPPVTLKGVAYGKGHWVISGGDSSIWSSEDGVNWIPAFRTGQEGGSFSFNSVFWDGLSFWTVGNFGDILKSNPLFNPVNLVILPSSTANQVILQVEGISGDQWDIRYANSLKDSTWHILTTVTLGEGPSTYEDPVSGNKYYILTPPGI